MRSTSLASRPWRAAVRCALLLLAALLVVAPPSRALEQQEETGGAKHAIRVLEPLYVTTPGTVAFRGTIVCKRARGKKFTLTVGGRDVPIADDLTWELEVTLEQGDNMVPMRCVDEAGAEAVREHRVVALPTIPGSFQRPVLRASTANELVELIGSDRVLALGPGVFDLSTATPQVLPNGIGLREGSGALALDGIKNLDIVGTVGERTVLTNTKVGGTTLVLSKCDRIRFTGVEFAHEPVADDPSADVSGGGVISIRHSHAIWFSDCTISGEGIGIDALRANGIVLDESTVRDCTRGAIFTKNTKHSTFQNSRFVDNGRGREGDFFVQVTGFERRDLDFIGLEIRGNRPGEGRGLFDLDDGHVYLYLKECTVEENDAAGLRGGEGARFVKTIDCKVQKFGR